MPWSHTVNDVLTGIEAVSQAVRQLDEMTQRNAALVQETNRAIEQTEERASEIEAAVAGFKIGPEAQTAFNRAAA